MKTTILLLTLIASLTLGSCSKNEDSLKPEIKLDVSTLTLPTAGVTEATTGFTVNLPWTITLGNPAPTWFSVDKLSGPAGTQALKITVSEANPSFTDVRKGYINIKAGDKTETITVAQPAKSAVSVTELTIDKPKATIAIGSTETLTATVSPSDATNKTVTWHSSDVAIATVANGVVTGVKVGVITITATTEEGGKSATCTLTVANTSSLGDRENENL